MRSNQTVLVTGGAGFIGSHVVDRLVEDGFRVVVVDSLASGRRENVPAGAEFHELDLRSPRLAGVFKRVQPDVVLHLAAVISIIRSVRNPAKDARANVLGSLNLLQQARRFGLQRFVLSSTGAMYGEPERLPCDESHPIRPVSPYGAGKNAVEGYVHAMAGLGGFGYTALRYANVYGPRQDPDGEAGVVGIFAQRMLDGREVVIYGDGTQERDFIYVSDVVEANVKALAQETDGIFNIGTGKPTSLNELFRQLARLTGYARPARYRPSRPGEVYRIYLDVRSAAKTLDWTSTVGFKAGLAPTADHFRRATAEG